MQYFSNIHSLAELKKEYRRLAFEHHPDKGGSTETMQKINLAFETLFTHWKNDTTTSTTATGYESDYAGASAYEYKEYVYNEYRFRGSNYKGQRPPEVVEIIRKWLKETYPRCTFSVTRKNYNSIYIQLIKADFEAFTKESGYVGNKQLNHYSVERDKDLTERAREVMQNVSSFATSYNYDDSDSMTDYFDTNFYLNLAIGNYRNPFKTELPKISCRKEDEQPVFKHPEGTAHKAIRQALGKARFSLTESTRYHNKLLLGEDAYGSKGEQYFWPKDYSSAKTAQKRIDKLNAAGILCKLTGYNGGCIELLGHTPETELKLEQERQEYIEAYNKWKVKYQPEAS